VKNVLCAVFAGNCLANGDFFRRLERKVRFSRFSTQPGHPKNLSRIMKKTDYARKIDTTGRLVIPAKLREELGIEIGSVYAFYLHEADGKRYLCIECPERESEIEKAKRILREAGVTNLD